jgi:hypothetical protein
MGSPHLGIPTLGSLARGYHDAAVVSARTAVQVSGLCSPRGRLEQTAAGSLMRGRKRYRGWLHPWLGLAVTVAAWGGAPPAIPSAYGPHVDLEPEAFRDSCSFSAEDRIVGTYYFYWYDVGTHAHVLNAAASTSCCRCSGEPLQNMRSQPGFTGATPDCPQW